MGVTSTNYESEIMTNEKYVWTYEGSIKVTGASSYVQFLILPEPQQVMYIELMIVEYDAAATENLDILFQLNRDGTIISYNLIEDFKLSSSRDYYYPCDDYPESFGLGKPNLIITSNDLLDLTVRDCDTNKTVRISIRAYLSTYDLPTVILRPAVGPTTTTTLNEITEVVF